MHEKLEQEIKFIKSEIKLLRKISIDSVKKAEFLENTLKEIYKFNAKQNGITTKHKFSGQTDGCTRAEI